MKRPVDALDDSLQRHRHRPGDDRQRRRAHAGGHALAERIDEAVHDPVVLVSVDPRKDGAARAQEPQQGFEAGLGIRQVVQDTDRIDEIERAGTVSPGKRRVVDVALHHVCVRHLAHVCVGGLDRIAEVHPDDFPRSIPRGIEGVPAVATARVKDDLVPKKIGLDGIDPVEELGLVLVVHLDELLPLPPESGRRPFDHRREARWQQARYPAANREQRRAGLAHQLASDDLGLALRVGFRVAQSQLAAARRAPQQLDEPRLHDALRATHSSDAPKGMLVRRRIGISHWKTVRRIPFDHAGWRSFSVSYSRNLRRTFSHWRPT